MEPIKWPTTDEGWCQWFRDLDTKYNERRDSPLHHDGRCPIHGHIYH